MSISDEFDSDSTVSSYSTSSSLFPQEPTVADCKETSEIAMSHYECSLAITSIAAEHNMSYS